MPLIFPYQTPRGIGYAAGMAKPASTKKAALRDEAAESGETRPKMRGEAHRERQRQRLLLAAGRVFERLGYNDASVADVIAEAGMSRRSFYEFFNSKEDVLVEYVGFGARVLGRAYDREAEKIADPLARVERFVDIFLELTAPTPMIGYQVMAAGERPRRVREDLVARLCDRFSDALSEAHRRGQLSRAPDPITVRMLVDAMDALALRYHLDGRAERMRETRPLIVDLILRAFR